MKIFQGLNSLRSIALAGTLAIGLGGAALAQNGYYQPQDYRYDPPSFRLAHDMGYEDGALVARQDLLHGKPFQPYPRGKYAHEDRGYRSDYGDKYAYMEHYARGYQQGYERTFGRY